MLIVLGSNQPDHVGCVCINSCSKRTTWQLLGPTKGGFCWCNSKFISHVHSNEYETEEEKENKELLRQRMCECEYEDLLWKFLNAPEFWAPRDKCKFGSGFEWTTTLLLWVQSFGRHTAKVTVLLILGRDFVQLWIRRETLPNSATNHNTFPNYCLLGLHFGEGVYLIFCLGVASRRRLSRRGDFLGKLCDGKGIYRGFPLSGKCSRPPSASSRILWAAQIRLLCSWRY